MNKDVRFFDYEKCYRHHVKCIESIRQRRIKGETIVAKPVLLLALIDGIDAGELNINRVVLNDRLEQRYETLMKQYTRHSIFPDITGIEKPFWHLESDGFWHLHYAGERQPKTHTPSKRWLKDNVQYASFDDDLWILLQNAVMRHRLRDYIIEHKLSDDHDSWGTMVAEGLTTLTVLFLAVA